MSGNSIYSNIGKVDETPNTAAIGRQALGPSQELLRQAANQIQEDALRDHMATQAPMRLGTKPLVPGGIKLKVSGVPCAIKRVKLPNRMDLKPEGDKYPAKDSVFGFGPAELGHLWFRVDRVQKGLIVCKRLSQPDAVALTRKSPPQPPQEETERPAFVRRTPTGLESKAPSTSWQPPSSDEPSRRSALRARVMALCGEIKTAGDQEAADKIMSDLLARPIDEAEETLNAVIKDMEAGKP